MFDNLKNLGALMGQAKQMGEKMEQLRAELARKTVEADAGAGAVRVVMNGQFQVLSIRLDKPLLRTLTGGDDDDAQAMIEELIAAAVNGAIEKTQELARQEMSKLTGGLNLPGMDQLMGR